MHSNASLMEQRYFDTWPIQNPKHVISLVQVTVVSHWWNKCIMTHDQFDTLHMWHLLSSKSRVLLLEQEYFDTCSIQYPKHVMSLVQMTVVPHYWNKCTLKHDQFDTLNMWYPGVSDSSTSLRDQRYFDTWPVQNAKHVTSLVKQQ